MTLRHLGRAQARRAALAAQGFGRGRPSEVSTRHVTRVIDQVAQFQIDSVSVVVRAHYMPLFSRLGPYDTALLERAAEAAPRRLFEYWGHAASLLDTRLHPALAFRRQHWAERGDRHLRRILAERPWLVDRVLADLRAAGPLTARDIEVVEERRRDHWGWNWSDVKYVLEHLYDSGVVAVAGRNASFERRYDLTDRVLPPSVLREQPLDPHDAHVALVRRAARALGVADETALATYFYLRRAPVRAAVQELVAAGELEPVAVDGLSQPYWRWHEARLPRTLEASALVSPFDSLVFDRTRLERLFGTTYRIEIYTPAARRVHGYYVYLFWLGDAVAARVDLKADRARGVLQVRSAWREPDAEAVRTARALAGHLHDLVGWLGLGEVEVAPVGSLAEELRRAV